MADKKLSDHFFLSELIQSNTATRLNIDNTPTPQITKNLTDSVNNLFEPVRKHLNVAMLISSGYRCPLLNKKVGGAQRKDPKTGQMVPTSAHCYGYAIDFTAPCFGNPLKVAREVAKFLKDNKIPFDQIIMEFGRWVHLAYKSPTGEQRGHLLVASKVNGKTKYTHVDKF